MIVNLPERTRGTERRRLAHNSRGECRIRMVDGQLFIDRADRDVWLEDSFLYQVAGPNKSNPWVTVTYQAFDMCDPVMCCQRWRGGHCFYGAILSIKAVNGTAIYNVGKPTAWGRWEATRADL